MAPSANALDLDDVIRLKVAGIGEDTILKLVEVERAVFYLSVQDMIDLKDAGASDYLIRELIDTPDRFGDRPGSVSDSYDDYDDLYDYDDVYDYDDDDINIYVYDYEPYDSDDYTAIFSNYYYDPFAYHWYWWPRAYVYYSPFWWARTSYYYGGHWCRDWWDPWGPCTWYCDWHYGYGHHCGTSHTRVATRRSWNRGAGAAIARLDRERTIWRKAGTDRPSSVRSKTRSTDQTHRAYRAGKSKPGASDVGYVDARTIRKRSARDGARASTERARYRSGSDRSRDRKASSRGSVGREIKSPKRDGSKSKARRDSPQLKKQKPPTPRKPAAEGKSKGSRGTTRSGGSKAGKSKAPAKKEPAKSPSSDRGRSGRR